jgi:hypothetical protein
VAAMARLLITANFRIFVIDKPGKPDRPVDFRKGMTIDEAAVAHFGQSVERWLELGYVKRTVK